MTHSLLLVTLRARAAGKSLLRVTNSLAASELPLVCQIPKSYRAE